MESFKKKRYKCVDIYYMFKLFHRDFYKKSLNINILINWH